MALAAAALLFVSVLAGCGQSASQIDDEEHGEAVESRPTDVRQLLDSARSMLVSGGWGVNLDWTRAEAGDSVPLHDLVPAASGDPWDAVSPEPSEYLIPILIDGVGVAEYVAFADPGTNEWRVGMAAMVASDWTAITSSAERLMSVLGADVELRIVRDAWTAVIGRRQDGETAVVFCLPSMGLRDPRLSRAEERAMSAIQEQRVYRNSEATKRMHYAFPLTFRWP